MNLSPRHAPLSGSGGFTIMEIMIATAILVVGLLGILALFPVAIHTGSETIQDTNAVLIAQSVKEAIEEGLQNRKGQSEDGKWTYFLFQHDGVMDPLPRRIEDAAHGADYYILLPEDDSDTTRHVVRRDTAYERGKVFIFPETDGKTWTVEVGGVEQTVSDLASGAPPNGGGNPLRADDDKDDSDREGFYEILLTYQLSGLLRHGEDEEEELAVEVDPIQEYSFAFAIRRAYNDASLAESARQFIPASELFEVEIMVFRSFVRETTHADPIYRSRFLIQK